MIGWVHQMCRSWGGQKRGLARESVAPSLWERIENGWSIAAAANQAVRPGYPEALTGEALLVANAIRRAIEARQLAERHVIALYLHYVERAPTKQKIEASGLKRKGYYRRVHGAHQILKPLLPQPHPAAGHNLVDTAAA